MSKFTIAYGITAHCVVYERNNTDWERIATEDIEINFNRENTENLLFRFGHSVFDVDGYKARIIYDKDVTMKTIQFFKDDNMYIVTNINQILGAALLSYKKMITMDTVMDILDFDFQAGIDLQNSKNVEDEF